MNHLVIHLKLMQCCQSTMVQYNMGWGVGGKEVQEGGDVCIFIADSCRVQQNTNCKAIILQLKKNIYIYMNPMMNHNGKEYFKKNVYVCVTESLSCPTRISNIVNQLHFNF